MGRRKYKPQRQTYRRYWDPPKAHPTCAEHPAVLMRRCGNQNQSSWTRHEMRTHDNNRGLHALYCPKCHSKCPECRLHNEMICYPSWTGPRIKL